MTTPDRRPRFRLHPDTPMVLAFFAAALLCVSFGAFLLVVFLRDALRFVLGAAEAIRVAAL